jgi:hypothetical protein
MDLSALSPEERMQLKSALDESSSGPPPGGGSDFVKAIIGVLEQVVAAGEAQAAQLSALEERAQKLESLVMDEIIGGIKSLYDDNMRTTGIEGLKSKYTQFSPFEGDFKELTQQDIWSELYDALQGVKDEERDGLVGSIHDGLKSKFDKLKGVAPATAVQVAIKKESAPEGESVEAPPPEVKAVETAAPEEDPLKAVVNSVKRLKGRGRSSGIMPGAL